MYQVFEPEEMHSFNRNANMQMTPANVQPSKIAISPLLKCTEMAKGVHSRYLCTAKTAETNPASVWM